MYLVINKLVTAVKVSKFSGHYLRKRSTLDIGVLSYIGIIYIRNTLPKSGTFLLGQPVYIYIYRAPYIYRVSQEGRTKVREGVPYVNVYRYNPKHLYPKLNGYGDNGKRSLKVLQLLHTY